MRLSISVAVLFAILTLGGCATLDERQEAAVYAAGFLVVPVLSQTEAFPGTSVEVEIEIHNTTDHDLRVPDPKELSLVFENVGTKESIICLRPFSLDGDNSDPKKKVLLKPGDWISAPHKFDLLKEADGIFLIRERYYGTIWVVLKIIKTPNRVAGGN